MHRYILEEVGSNVTDVAISPDGSWKVVTENDENVENLSPAVLDLARDENEMEASGNTQIPMVNQSSSDSMEVLPQLPQTFNNDGQQQQFMNFPVCHQQEKSYTCLVLTLLNIKGYMFLPLDFLLEVTLI